MALKTKILRKRSKPPVEAERMSAYLLVCVSMFSWEKEGQMNLNDTAKILAFPPFLHRSVVIS